MKSEMKSVTVVTGASAGLGAEFARQLAKQGHNLVLTARRYDKLDELAKNLRSKYGIKTLVVACDLSEPGTCAPLLQRISEENLTVDTLINNAGFGLKGEFIDLDLSQQLDMIALNCMAMTDLCHTFLPGMIARKSGQILNVASTAAFQAGPLMAVYYATKAYVLSFSEALHEEVRHHGTKVSCLCPGPTNTEFFEVADMTKTALFKMAGTPEKVVADGLLGLKRNQAFTISGWRNKIVAQSTRLVPRAVTRRLAHALQK
jgi:uncharacterized protein